MSYSKQQLINSFPYIDLSVSFRLMIDADVELLFKIRSNPDVIKYVDGTLLKQISEAHSFIEKINNSLDAIRFVIEVEGEAVGTVGLYHIDFVHCFASVGYDLLPEYWGKGLGTKLIEKFTDYILINTFLNRVEAQTHPDNLSSAKVLRKAGFIYEGTLRQNFWINGQFDNAFLFSKIKEDVLKKVL